MALKTKVLKKKATGKKHGGKKRKGVAGGKRARVAALGATAFCCRCGIQLDASGKCQNNLCVFYRQKPVC